MLRRSKPLTRPKSWQSNWYVLDSRLTNTNLPTLVPTPDFPETSSIDGGSGHEMLAIVCIKHLQCLDRQTLLKPWISTLNGRHECPLRGYATNFWDEHSRMAQSNLTAALHQAILGAISKENKSDPLHMPTNSGQDKR